MPAWNAVIFTGHMIDQPGRTAPRFPPALEAAAAQAIRERLVRTMEMGRARIGIASAARGGDILFHEQARALGLSTMIVLPFAPGLFEERSVAGLAEDNWVSRFRTLWASTPEDDRVDMNLPRSSEAYAHCNTRMIELARAKGTYHLIALWDGKQGDGPGGTADLVRKAIADGDKPHIIYPADLQ